MDIGIIVATHKKYRMPTDSIYVPLQVGRAGKDSIGLPGDDTGENISEKNSRYNELTAIYWAWKNLDADYIGLTHYRRHFTARSSRECRGLKDPFEAIADRREMEQQLLRHDVILPAKRRYYIETIYSHHIHLPYAIPEDLECLRRVMRELEPEYAPYLELMLKRRWAHMFNMFVMKRELFDSYCQWMFPIIDEVDRRIDMTGRRPIEARLYISEFMLDTWIERNGIPYGEMRVLFMEKESLAQKGWMALKRRLGINYDEQRQYSRGQRRDTGLPDRK